MILGSAANNVIFNRPGGSAGQMGIFLDDHVTPSVFRAFGKAFPATVGLPAVPFATSGGMGVATSSDGLHWENWTSAAGLDVNGDTSNNALWDPHLRQYLGFSRLDNHVNYDRYGLRKETISNTNNFSKWEGHAVCLRGTHSGTLDGESYSLVPFRLPSFAPGLYLGLGAFFDQNTGVVTNELLRSTTFGRNWTRLAPGQAFIPHGRTLDNFTTYAARPLL